jgi:hypothetical protein
MADVRTTQDGVLPFFSFSPLATVHGWARVQLQAIKALKPAMPLAVPDVNPKHVAVTFVNNSGTALTCPGAPVGTCTWPLTGPTSAGTLNGWSGLATIPIPAKDQMVRMRVSVGPANGDCTGTQSTATYTCYDYDATGTGLLAIRSYDNSAVGSTPILRSVTPTTCMATNLPGGTPYFSAYQSSAGKCDQVGLTADVAFPSGASSKAVTYAIVQGKCPKNPNGTMTNTTGTTWASNLTTLPIGNGVYNICLSYSYKDGGNQSGDFNGNNSVQQIFSASDGSDPAQPGGPILVAQFTKQSDGSPAYSFPAGTNAAVSINIALTGGVHVNPKCPDPTGNNAGKNYTCASDPTILLRTASSSGSLNYAIDCGIVPGHTGGNLYQMFRYGCANSFSINQPDICPDPTAPAPDPTSCAPVITGDKTGQVRQALNERIQINGSCAPNNYPNTAVPGDPRIVMLVDTDFSAYLGNQGGSTSSDVPVVNFATFYVTGWDRANNDCSNFNEPPPPNSDSKGNSANLWGHFISFETNGDPSGIKCAANALAPCVAALVR